MSFKIYDGGSCHRADFDSAGATLTTTGTARIVISDAGIRIDGVVETYVGSADQFGSVFNNVTLNKQRLGEDDADSREDRSDHDFSLSELRGKYTVKSSGVDTVCTNPGGCAAASPVIVPLNLSADAQGEIDDEGNYCGVSVAAHVPPAGEASSASVPIRVTSGKVASFDSESGQGDFAADVHVGGTCHGARFDGAGASLVATSTAHFVISNSGRRIDALATSYVSLKGFIGGVVNTTTLIRDSVRDSDQEHR